MSLRILGCFLICLFIVPMMGMDGCDGGKTTVDVGGETETDVGGEIEPEVDGWIEPDVGGEANVPTHNVDFTGRDSWIAGYFLTSINGHIAEHIRTDGSLFLHRDNQWHLWIRIGDNEPLEWRGKSWNVTDVITETVERDEVTYIVKYPSRMRLTTLNGVPLNCKISGVELNLDGWREKRVYFMGMELWIGEIIGERDALYTWQWDREFEHPWIR